MYFFYLFTTLAMLHNFPPKKKKNSASDFCPSSVRSLFQLLFPESLNQARAAPAADSGFAAPLQNCITTLFSTWRRWGFFCVLIWLEEQKSHRNVLPMPNGRDSFQHDCTFRETDSEADFHVDDAICLPESRGKEKRHKTIMKY